MGSRDPGLSVWLREEVLLTLPRPAIMLSKTPKGLKGSINSPEPTPITLSVPHSRLTVWAARLSFCRYMHMRPLTRLRLIRGAGILLLALGIVHLVATPHIATLVREAAS